jgi:hypothetical protein
MVTVENAKKFLTYRKMMSQLRNVGQLNTAAASRIKRNFVLLARKITYTQSKNSQAMMIKAFRASRLRLAKEYKITANNKLKNLLNNQPDEILARNTISRALFKSKFLNDVRKRIEDKRLLAYSKQLLMYEKYLEHAYPEHQNTQELFRKYTSVYRKAGEVAKKIIPTSNDLNQAINVAKYVVDYYKNGTQLRKKLLSGKLGPKNVEKIESKVKSIQSAYRKSKLVPTNQQVLKLEGRMDSRKTFENWNTVNKFKAKRGGFNKLIGSIRKARNIEAAPVVTSIQKYFRGYKSRVIEPRKKFLMDLSADKEKRCSSL